MKLICFDCDSTLSSIEGIDELGRLRGPEVFARAQAMTEDAMNGRIPIEDVFARRLEAIRPSRGDTAQLAKLYLRHVEPTAQATVAHLQAAGWTPVIISAGFTQAIEPLAALLGIARIEAVGLRFGADGAYQGFDRAFPATRTGGKRLIVERLRSELGPGKTVVVGDGVSDLEAAPAADLFIGFGRFVTRERVKREAAAFVTSLAEIPALV